jgi:hypothetical protein
MTRGGQASDLRAGFIAGPPRGRVEVREKLSICQPLITFNVARIKDGLRRIVLTP